MLLIVLFIFINSRIKYIVKSCTELDACTLAIEYVDAVRYSHESHKNGAKFPEYIFNDHRRMMCEEVVPVLDIIFDFKNSRVTKDSNWVGVLQSAHSCE